VLRRRRAVLPGFGGLLGAVQRVEETGEGLGVGRVIFPPAKVPDHFAHNVGLAGVLPFFDEVIVDADTRRRRVRFKAPEGL